MGKKILERFSNGIIKENPILVGMLGICSTLAVTTSAINGLGMGASTLIVLALSNLIISLLRNFIPNSVRIPGHIVIVASLVTIIQFFMQGFVPDLYESLGIFIPLIVVNCIILGRAESYAAKNGPLLSFFDGIGVGIGFTITLTILGAIREFLGSGTVFSTGSTELFKLPEGTWYEPASIFVLAPGAFFVLAFMTAVMNKAKRKKGLPQAEVPDYTQDGGCASCSIDSCAGKTIAQMHNENKVEMQSQPIDVVVKEKKGEEETKE